MADFERVLDPEQKLDGGHSNFRLPGRTVCRTALGATVALIVLAIAVFTAFPRLDLFIDNLFSSLGHPFPARDIAVLHGLRALMITMTDGLMAAALAVFLLSVPFPKIRVIRQRVLGFMIFTYITVPGVIVNLGFKQHWGRARPRHVTEFGGTSQFTPPLQPADQCAGNCSFVSGEASALFTVATLLVLFFVSLLPPRWQGAAIGLIGAVATFGSGLRVAFGAHFASDVIFAALLSVSLTLIFYMLAGLGALRSPLTIDGPRRRSA